MYANSEFQINLNYSILNRISVTQNYKSKEIQFSVVNAAITDKLCNINIFYKYWCLNLCMAIRKNVRF